MFGQNVTEHNPAPSPSGHPLLSGPPTLNDIHQIFTTAEASSWGNIRLTWPPPLQLTVVQRVAHKHDVITRAPNFNYHHVGHTIQIDEASEPRAFKWHAGRSYWTNWNPFFGLLLGGIGDHSMEFGYIRALNSHVNSRSDSTVAKPWLTEYTEQEK